MLKLWGSSLFICLFLFVSRPVWAADSDLSLQAAASYQKGAFAEAASDYLRLIDKNPHNASLYHNLGAAFYRKGELGAAVAAYLRALQLKPRDPDLRYNLNFLLNQGSDKLEAERPAQGWKRLLIAPLATEKELFYLSCALFSFSCLGAAALLRRSRRASVAVLLAGLLGSGYVFGNFAFKRFGNETWGAVQTNELAAYSSPTKTNAVVIFQLHTGAPVLILEKAGDWLKIGLSDQKTGWVEASGVVIFGEAFSSYQPPASPRGTSDPIPT